MWHSLIFLLVPSVVLGKTDTCKVNLQNEDSFSNVLLNVLHWLPPVIRPEVKTKTIPNGQVIQANCGNGFIRNDLVGNEYVFQCTQGKYNNSFPFEDILCRSNYHKKTRIERISSIQIRSAIFKCDAKDQELYQIKTVQPDGVPKLLYTVCLDAKTMRTKFVFQPARDTAPPRNLILEDRNDVWGFDGYGKNANEMLQISKGYVKKIQQERTTDFYSNKYSSSNQYPYYFNRGHLAPYADYSNPDERKATCEYINAAPQWDIINKGSWSLVEKEARLLRQKNPIDWEIYTGTYGSIPTPKGLLLLAHIYENRKLKKKLLPVPMLYWKLIHNKNDKQKSKAFVGVNNPEIRSPNDIVNKYKICTPVSNNKTSVFEGSEFYGFTYECRVDDLLKALQSEENIIKETYLSE